MSKEISLNNGSSYMSAEDAMPAIDDRDLWETVVGCMDNETRERVHAELAPCTNLAFQRRYLELAPEDLILG